MKQYYKIKNGIVYDEDIPQEIFGLAREDLADLSFTPEELNLRDCAWWPSIDITKEISRGEEYTDKIKLTPDFENKVVRYEKVIRPWTEKELKAHIDLLIEGVNNEVANAYERPTKFTTEYLRRETQAREYLAIIESLGEDEPIPPAPRLVANFALSANMDQVEAAKLTVKQADDLYDKQDRLADLRMRKYEISRATDVESAERLSNIIITAIKDIAKTIT